MGFDINKMEFDTTFTRAEPLDHHQLYASPEGELFLLLKGPASTKLYAVKFSTFHNAMNFCNDVVEGVRSIWPEDVDLLEKA